MKTNVPQIELGAYSDRFSAMQHILNSYVNNNIFTCMPVEVVEVVGNKVNVKPLVAKKTLTNEVIEITDDDIIYNIPVMQIKGSKIEIKVEITAGDKGILLACMRDISNYKNTHQKTEVASNRTFSQSDGLFLPLDFIDDNPQSVSISYGQTNLILNENSVTINCENASVNASSVDVSADTVNIEGSSINLGSGGVGVARIGDSVDLETGKITSGSSVVKAG